MSRVLDTPVRVPLDGALATDVGQKLLKRLLRNPATSETPLPWDIQMQTLLELDPFLGAATGVYGQEGVGSGKTLSTFLLGPTLAIARGVDPESLDAPRTLLLVPSDTHMRGKGQTFQRLAEWQKHYRIPAAHAGVGDHNLGTFFVVSHGQASIPQNTDLFHRIRPELVVIDEAHAFAGDSVRRRRLVSWFADEDGAAKYGINPRLCVFSGTLWKKAFEDISVFLEICLRHNVPAPVMGSNPYEIQQRLMVWASVLDAHGEPDWIAKRALEPLCKWATMYRTGLGVETSRNIAQSDLGGNAARYRPPGSTKRTRSPAALRRASRVEQTSRAFQREARQAFQLRLELTPGVVLTRSVSCEARLVIEEDTRPGPFAFEIAEFASTWTLPPCDAAPNGEELQEAKDYARHAKTLRWGFFRVWDWASVGFPGRLADPDYDLESIPPGDHEWLAARRGWNAAEEEYVRNHGTVGSDSGALARKLAAEGKLGPAATGAWERWAAVKERYWSVDPESGAKLRQPPGRVVWLDKERTRQALRETVERFMSSSVASKVVWYSSPALGGVLQDLGFSVFGRGSDTPPDNASLPACSINVHGTGKNMQAWSNALVLEPPVSNYRWEQLIGRHHRPGQQADEVRFRICGEIPGAAWQEAVTALDMSSQRPRLLLADRVRL